MSSVIGALRVVLGLDSAQFETGIKRVSRTNRALEKSTFDAAKAVRAMGAALGIVSVGAAGREFLRLSDASKQLTSQLKLATAQTGSFVKAQEDVRRIAAVTRGGLKEVSDLYATFQRNARELGITQDESARATETITKAFKISGATAAEAAGGLRQFLQGIQSGTLRGEELNSVLENAPRLARALADGLGVTIGQLREMGQAGQLTGRAVMGALTDAAEQIDREFAELPVTFEESMTTLHNAAIITFGAFDRGGQFSSALANFITQGSGGFADLERRAMEMGIDIRSNIEGLRNVFDPMLEGARRVFGEIRAEGQSLFSGFENDLRNFDKLTNWVSKQGIAGALITGNSVGDWWSGTTSGTNTLSTFRKGRQASETELRRAAGISPVSGILARLSEANSHAAAGPTPAVTASGGGKGGKGKKGPSEETLRKRAERELERAADNLRRFTDELARGQADLVSATAELSRDLTQRADAEKGQIEASRASRERAIRADRDLADAQRQQLLLLNEQEAVARKALVDQQLRDDLAREAAQIEQDRADLAIELLGYSRDLARTATQAREIELRMIDHAFEAERARLEQIKATSAVTSAEYAYAKARLANLPTMQNMAQTVARERTQGPWEAYLSRLPRTIEEADEAFEAMATNGIQSVVDGLADAASGARSLGDVFKNVTRQIIADLIRIQMQKAIVGALGSVLGIGAKVPGLGNAASGSLEANFDAAFGISGRRAGGGPVSAGKAYLVGEEGPEVIVPRFGGIVIPNHDLTSSFAADFGSNDNGPVVVQIVPTPYFDAVVKQGAAEVAAPMAAASGQFSRQAAAGDVQRRSRRRIPG